VKPVRAVIVDDEELARKRLRRLLDKHPGEIAVIAEASNGEEAVAAINAEHPDVIFLDVQMPGVDGFEVVRRLKEKPFIIFATAYDQYALRAFEENSVDYLLKPIEQDRLDKAIDKLRGVLPQPSPSITENLERMIARLSAPAQRRLKVQVGDKMFFVEHADITYIEAKEKYTFVHTADKEYMMDLTLNELEERLDPAEFVRIHRASIVNVKHIREVVKWFAGRFKVRLKDKAGTELMVSRGYADRIRRL